ncbi:hypothetical protein [Kitasatospora arboriphila]|uniref:hypothetical protein n=1 Tax=Kitasatospora arboriphila TaxID=258052 RepID=UPI0031DD420C
MVDDENDPDETSRPELDYGYGLEYEPDPFADPQDEWPQEWPDDPTGDDIEAMYEAAWRDGTITRDSPAAKAWKERPWLHR